MIRKYMINGNIPAEIVPTIGRTIVQIGSKWIEEYFGGLRVWTNLICVCSRLSLALKLKK